MSMSSLSSIPRFAPPPTQARPAIQASGPASVVQNQRTGALTPKILLEPNSVTVFSKCLGSQIQDLLLRHPSGLDGSILKSEETMHNIMGRLHELALGTAQAYRKQLEIIIKETPNDLELIATDNMPCASLRGWFNPGLRDKLTFRTSRLFTHRQPSQTTGLMLIHTKMSIPDPYDQFGSHFLLNADSQKWGFSSEYLERLKELLRLDSLNSPEQFRELLAYPPLTDEGIEQLLKSAHEANEIVKISNCA